MREYVIYTDSSADFDEEMVQQLGIEVQPLLFTLDGTNYRNWPDGREMQPDVFYSKLREGGSSSTSQVNVAEFTEAFRPVLLRNPIG